MAIVFRPTSLFFWFDACSDDVYAGYSQEKHSGISGICSNLLHESLSWSQKPISAVQNWSGNRLKSQEFVCMIEMQTRLFNDLKASALGLHEGITWLPEHNTQVFLIYFTYFILMQTAGVPLNSLCYRLSLNTEL